MRWTVDTRDAEAVRRMRRAFARGIEERFGPSADSMAAELVLGELIGNAVRHAPGTARIAAAFDARGVTLSVEDIGNGFSPSAAPREMTLLEESGRGLAIVRRIADRLEIACRESGGCRVTARLDVRTPRPTMPEPARRSPRPEPGDPPLVMRAVRSGEG